MRKFMFKILSITLSFMLIFGFTIQSFATSETLYDVNDNANSNKELAKAVFIWLTKDESSLVGGKYQFSKLEYSDSEFPKLNDDLGVLSLPYDYQIEFVGSPSSFTWSLSQVSSDESEDHSKSIVVSRINVKASPGFYSFDSSVKGLISPKDSSISHITVFYEVVDSAPDSDVDSDNENQEQEDTQTPVENQTNNQSASASQPSETIFVDLEEEAIPESAPRFIDIDMFEEQDDTDSDETFDDEAIFEDIALEDTPLGISTLPQTGQLPSELFYSFGAMLIVAGVLLKNRK